ncbi:iron-siderophore ABC transporter substrate-binding protein, partial [Mycolicibacterium insubricum]|nr:iron-siderophore ABC transporter substrate-binding protein [Mycolicibacterium insubricum]
MVSANRAGCRDGAGSSELRELAARQHTGRSAPDLEVRRQYRRAHQLGEAIDGAHFQASIVQFTPGSVRVYGRENFPQTVLAAVG